MMELTAEARARVDRYLEAVEERLRAAGKTREERRAVVDDLEGQILEMVEARGAGTAEGVERVLSTMDRPEAYGVREGVGKETGGPRVSKAAVAGLVMGLVALVLAAVMVPVAADVSALHRSWLAYGVWTVALLVVGPLAVTGTVLGWVGWGQIRRSKGEMTGKGVALAAGLLRPVVMVLLLA
jgi:hypothetical protein